MVQIVIAALAKGMAVANFTLEEFLTLLNASLRPFLGVGKYSKRSVSVTTVCEKFLNGHPAREVSSSGRAIPYTNFRTKSRVSSVVQSVGIAKASDCLLDNPTPRVACSSELMPTRWVRRFEFFSLGVTQQALSKASG